MSEIIADIFSFAHSVQIELMFILSGTRCRFVVQSSWRSPAPESCLRIVFVKAF